MVAPDAAAVAADRAQAPAREAIKIEKRLGVVGTDMEFLADQNSPSVPELRTVSTKGIRYGIRNLRLRGDQAGNEVK